MAEQLSIVGTYAARIAYNTALLLDGSAWFQEDNGPDAPGGYYRLINGIWTLDNSYESQTVTASYIFNKTQYIRTLIVVGPEDMSQGARAYVQTFHPTDGAYLSLAANNAGGRTYLVGSSGSGNAPGAGKWEVYDLAAAATRLALDQNGVFTVAYECDVAAIFNAQGRFKLTGEITPAQITSNQNDYAPAGYLTASVWRISSDAARDITGIVAGDAGEIRILSNVGAFAITLKNASASSAAANRFTLNADIAIPAKGSAIVRYDSTLANWVCIAKY